MASLSLRLRILLFFALMGLGSLAILGLALYFGHGRAMTGNATPGFVNAGLIAGVGIAVLTVAIWLLFDENVAKPIERLAAALRTHVRSMVFARARARRLPVLMVPHDAADAQAAGGDIITLG